MIDVCRDFFMICEDLIRPSVHPVDCPKPLIQELFSEIVSRVINTMMNSLLQCAAMVTRIQANKGVDTDVALSELMLAYKLIMVYLSNRLLCTFQTHYP